MSLSDFTTTRVGTDTGSAGAESGELPAEIPVNPAFEGGGA